MDPNEKNNEIVELTDEELDEILADDERFGIERNFNGAFFYANVNVEIYIKLRADFEKALDIMTCF